MLSPFLPSPAACNMDLQAQQAFEQNAVDEILCGVWQALGQQVNTCGG